MKISAVKLPQPQLDAKQPTTASQVLTSDLATSADKQPNNLVKAVEKLNKDAEVTNRQVRFALQQDTHRVIVEVVDKATNQVVSTFPPKQILEMAASLQTEVKAGVAVEDAKK